jgi:hypothetical protein
MMGMKHGVTASATDSSATSLQGALAPIPSMLAVIIEDAVNVLVEVRQRQKCDEDFRRR